MEGEKRQPIINTQNKTGGHHSLQTQNKMFYVISETTSLNIVNAFSISVCPRKVPGLEPDLNSPPEVRTW